MIQSRTPTPTATTCAFPGCHNLFQRVTCKRYCSKACGSTARVVGRNKACSVDGCDRFADRAGYCGAHYRRVLDGRPLDTPIQPKVRGGAECRIDGCTNKETARGLCPTHKYRKRKALSLVAPVAPRERNRRWIDRSGYVRLEGQGTGTRLEHRLIMEAALGRPLERHENVHHKNGVRHDNRLENLELWCVPQPPGQRIADLVAWVVENYPAEIADAAGWDHMALLGSGVAA